ncbi:hypothetical protein [Mucilaginibacter lappiensis]|uniref:hypothetical protein n=1 Tax=Mucilaginibacter lappiensis TaxID=354630 RepID=UPI003D1D5141
MQVIQAEFVTYPMSSLWSVATLRSHHGIQNHIQFEQHLRTSDKQKPRHHYWCRGLTYDGFN